MKKFISLVSTLSFLCGIAAAAMIVISVVVVVQMVWVRYILQESSIWQTEFVTYLLIAATFIGSPYVLMMRGHVNVDLIPLYLKFKWRFRLAIFASVISLLFCLLITWTGFWFWYEAWEKTGILIQSGKYVCGYLISHYHLALPCSRCSTLQTLSV